MVLSRNLCGQAEQVKPAAGKKVGGSASADACTSDLQPDGHVHLEPVRLSAVRILCSMAFCAHARRCAAVRQLLQPVPEQRTP